MSIVGAYLMIDKENYEEYLKAVGSEPRLLKLSTQVTEMENFKLIGEDEYRVKTYSSDFDTYVIRFRMGREFNETLWDGRNCKTTFVMESETKLVQTQINVDTEVKGKIVREFDHGNMAMNMTLTCGDVVATISYQKLKTSKGSNEAEREEDSKMAEPGDSNGAGSNGAGSNGAGSNGAGSNGAGSNGTKSNGADSNGAKN